MVAHGREIVVETRGRGLVDITRQVREIARGAGVEQGVVQIFIRHTSASLIIGENADPDVLSDLERFMSDLVPDGDPRFAHDAEGPDDMPAHVRSILTQPSINLPLRSGDLHLGTWQAIYVWEHRTRPHRRHLDVTVLG